ncbi:Ku protein [Dyella sp.]|uniref:non-homologous end joining protein Ku n=1 Tax=Dyella sp. TaxID=1869338 RepID=UPI002D78A899|nr:Ku protein [Dyella sp.]HET7332406.1 Ku protein [Dyella sp.]
MARPIWTGNLTFGLLNVPVSLMSGERGTDLHFRMLDSRNKAPVRYERVNAETGEEVPWKEIVKAFEYKKGNYVVLEPEDIKSASSENRESVEVEAFVEAADIGPEYFEKPYILVPGKKAEKGYVLLRETLKRTGKVGIARVVIRTREYLSAVIPREHALILVLMRFQQELVDAEEFSIPSEDIKHYRISERELSMAEQLIESMTSEWRPVEYKDDFRDRLRQVIEKRMKSKGALASIEEPEAEEAEAATNVVDFMALLKKSIDTKKRTPAEKAEKTPARKAAKKGKATKKSGARRKAS